MERGPHVGQIRHTGEALISDTIFALSTARGRAAIAVVRLSGPSTAETVRALGAGALPARRASLRTLRDPRTGEMLDKALVLWLPAPHSFSGEDMAELHIHGGVAVTAALLEALAALPNLRPAEPGEFTARAFRHGRLDLTAVEGLSDLIGAETSAQRRQALRQLDGALAALVAQWRGQLTALMASLEAEIDFPDEELGLERTADNAGPLGALRQEIADHLAATPRGERLRAGYRAALVGAPNVGKSSLLNALAKREVAIVTDEPGTTRDLLELHLDLGGYPVILTDMAGLRDNPGRVEAIGIARARALAQDVALRLFLTDQALPLDPAVDDLRQPDDLILHTKADLRPTPSLGPNEILLSAVTGQGLEDLMSEIEARAIRALGAQDHPVFSRLRHRNALAETQLCLDRAFSQWETAPPELVAEDLRLANRALGRITGQIDVEEILDVVFSEFCIGK